MTPVDPALMEKPRKKRRKKSYAIAVLDPLFSKVVRLPGRCEKCGATANLQCAHIVSRRYRATRWDEGNAMPLCAKCHTFFTHWPLEWEAWLDERYPGLREEMKAKALSGRKWTERELVERAGELRAVLAAHETEVS